METLIPSIAGVLLSLAAKYLPGFSDWYEDQTPQTKSLGMLAALVGAVVVIMIAGCADLAWQAVCQGEGWRAVLQGFVAALVATVTANQATYIAIRKL